jgi:chromosome segregation ATPase
MRRTSLEVKYVKAIQERDAAVAQRGRAQLRVTQLEKGYDELRKAANAALARAEKAEAQVEAVVAAEALYREELASAQTEIESLKARMNEADKFYIARIGILNAQLASAQAVIDAAQTYYLVALPDLRAEPIRAALAAHLDRYPKEPQQ